MAVPFKVLLATGYEMVRFALLQARTYPCLATR